MIDKIIVEPDQAASASHEYLRTEYLYDSYGNVREEKTIGNTVVRTESGTFENQALPPRVTTTITSYPVAGEESISGSGLAEPVKREVITNAENQTMTIETDLDHGQPLAVKDINNLDTQYEYDEYGLKPKVIAPDKTYSHVIEHDWVRNDNNAPANARYYTKTVFESNATTASQQTPLTEYYDEHGNMLRSYQHRWHTDSKPVIVDYTFDRLDRLTEETMPYYLGEGRSTTTRTYVDYTQHVLKLTDHREPVQNFTYDRYTVTRTHSDGYQHREKRNAKGQVILSENGDPSNLSRLSYKFDDAGRIRYIYDNDNNVTTRSYDNRDNLSSLVDPDRGLMEYKYDSYGAMVWQKNAKNQETQYSYDRLARLTQQEASDYQEIRTYDTRPKGVGKLASVSYLSLIHI